MHASITPTVRRVAATSALALVALSGAAGTAVAAPGNQGNGSGDGPSSRNAAPQADEPQGKAKAKGHDNGPKPSAGQGSQGSPGASGGSASGGSASDGSEAGGSADTEGSGASGGGSAQGSPPGNNGTVKIAPLGEMDGIPNNSPHPGCDFQVEWYGFDEGADVVSRVSFAMQAPTGDVGLTVNGPGEVFVGEDPASGAGQDPDGVQAYTLSFDGAPHPQQGYHVKLTVNTPRSNGSDVKHKVFWVEDCEDSGTSSLAPPDGEENGSVEGPGEGSEGSGSESGSVSGAGSDSADGAGTASRSGVSQDVTTSGESDTPTSVDAGATGSDIARGSLIGLLVAAVGGALLWYARRTRAHG
ncbi:hypothetical protein G7072_10400 [Nocardioides sp. HDW12B]|uniref:hypothetical protein n=1 Tax=Nocardioides sp. HDW12B TaxID=2714939 RepID=UPI00140AD820|nr:hypothetical protein [Nocardioides sp. HDW12B]QIK66695.1 hypothetical protein G7072_10400 [Nocardioides sp. HDW12B]